MNYYEVAPKKIIRAGADCFTFHSEEKLKIGQIVEVEIGNNLYTGLIIKKTKKPTFKTKPITSVIDLPSIPVELIKTIIWIGQYYKAPLATVLPLILPSHINHQTRQKELRMASIPTRNRTNNLLNSQQLNVINQIDKYESGSFLLQGITGSGKTEVYINLAKKSLASGKSAIILTPEISLSPQLAAEFSNHFDNVTIFHSGLSDRNRFLIWKDILYSDTPRVVIGPRSALFLPLKKVGLIVLDEAHDQSYKQEKTPRYSCLRAATVLGRQHHCPVIFGSATPNVADYYLALNNNRPILKLSELATPNSSPAKVSIVDMRQKNSFKKHYFLSDKLIENITLTLSQKRQVLVFHNRRGNAKLSICGECGWQPICHKCFVPLTLHADKFEMKCHLCGHSQPVTLSCPNCKSTNLVHKGIGTKLVESELRRLFPEAKIARFDIDNDKTDRVEQNYQAIYDGNIDIIIGTQMIAKGFDLPNLRMVGIIQADNGLMMPDYTTDEKVFQLINQVTGRVGRNKSKTTVIIQTFQPDNPVIKAGLEHNYESFYENSIKKRQSGLYPPFCYLLKAVCNFKTERSAISACQNLLAKIKPVMDHGITIVGPSPAFYERLNGRYRWQIIFKSPSRANLVKLIEQIPKNNWQIELDPISLL